MSEINDILGIKPIAEATKEVIETGLDGIRGFVNAVFKPGLEELGLMAKDQVRFWRLNNIISILDKAQGKLRFDGHNLHLQANARVGLCIIEEGSKVDNEELQELWAGLFASCCTADGKDDSNMIFVDLIRRLSVIEARILKYACEHATKVVYPNGLILADKLEVTCEELKTISGNDDVIRLDSELDHLSSLSLLSAGMGGFDILNKQLNAIITPSALGLNLYYKANSYGVTPLDFWGNAIRQAEKKDYNTGWVIDEIFEKKMQ